MDMDVSSLNKYLASIGEYLYDQEWESSVQLSDYISIRGPHRTEPHLQIEEPDSFTIKRHMDAPFDSIIAHHLRALYQFNRGLYESAFRTQSALVQIVAKEIIQKRKDENWFLPIVYKLCSDLRLCAKAADHNPEARREGEHTSFYEQAAAPIMECYRNSVADIRTSFEVSKRLSILNLTNHLFRIYFKINKLNLLKPLIRAVDNCGPLYEHFSVADKVTYKYFFGRKAMFDSDLKSAEDALSYAFRNCPSASMKNKRLILMYLVPVKMFLGHMPKDDFLNKYSLSQFCDVAAAVKQGNVLLLEQVLLKHEAFFIKCGIFLMLEKLKFITYRTLFKKVCGILGTHQVPLESFLKGLKFMEVEEVDADEVACILANLIHQGKIKGYISHQHQKLVISKQNPFPSLSSVVA